MPPSLESLEINCQEPIDRQNVSDRDNLWHLRNAISIKCTSLSSFKSNLPWNDASALDGVVTWKGLKRLKIRYSMPCMPRELLEFLPEAPTRSASVLEYLTLEGNHGGGEAVFPRINRALKKLDWTVSPLEIRMRHNFEAIIPEQARRNLLEKTRCNEVFQLINRSFYQLEYVSVKYELPKPTEPPVEVPSEALMDLSRYFRGLRSLKIVGNQSWGSRASSFIHSVAVTDLHWEDVAMIAARLPHLECLHLDLKIPNIQDSISNSQSCFLSVAAGCWKLRQLHLPCALDVVQLVEEFANARPREGSPFPELRLLHVGALIGEISDSKQLDDSRSISVAGFLDKHFPKLHRFQVGSHKVERQGQLWGHELSRLFELDYA